MSSAGVLQESEPIDVEPLKSKFIVDFHVHSHYSVATSPQLVPEWLDYWARLKGVTVVGSGDFTHPGWLQELKEKLEPAEPGLFRLKKALQRDELKRLPWAGERPVRFLLTSEISSIYKKRGRVRKVHNLVFAPDFATVENIQKELTRLKANISSDGRPILGMDARDLLELALSASKGTAFFVPAHIWTPWFSLLGDKSGFDSLAECFDDLSGHIHAVETGLSSDPPMNWLCSFLDSCTLISNSDAHSPDRVGREANLFHTELSYDALLQAMKTGDRKQFLGTVEFFPQEGKYHFDGHRRCGIRLHPAETSRQGGLCPACGNPVTVGVLHRVLKLGDRTEGQERPLRHPFHSLIPLREILSEILRTGPDSRKVEEFYFSVLKALGPELPLLFDTPLERIREAAGEELAEAIRRMRRQEVFIEEGYDGEYGRIRVFAAQEIGRTGQGQLFAEQQPLPAAPRESPAQESFSLQLGKEPLLDKKVFQPPDPEKPNPEQLDAIRHFQGPALIIAGPGTGKTHVLTQRIACLISERAVEPQQILAVTFTNKAAREMRERLRHLLAGVSDRPLIATFHAFGLGLLKEHADRCGRSLQFCLIGEEERLQLIKSLALPQQMKAAAAADFISHSKQKRLQPV